MDIDASAKPVSKGMFWSGWVISVLPTLLLIMSGVMKLLKPKEVIEGFEKLGYGTHLALPLGIVELVSVVVYLIPRTSVLGAVLLTGYLGGAIATHVRLGEPFFIPLILGLLIWAGLYFRDPQVRALLPWRG